MTIFAPNQGARVSFEARDIGTSYADIVPASGSVVTLDSMIVANKTGSTVTCAFAKVDGSTVTVILPTISIAANSIYQLQNHHVTLDPGQKFQIKAGTGSALDATVTVMQALTR